MPRNLRLLCQRVQQSRLPETGGVVRGCSAASWRLWWDTARCDVGLGCVTAAHTAYCYVCPFFVRLQSSWSIMSPQTQCAASATAIPGARFASQASARHITCKRTSPTTGLLCNIGSATLHFVPDIIRLSGIRELRQLICHSG